MPALLSTQRPRHATCRRYFRPSGLGMRHAGASGGVCGRRRIWPGTCIRPVGGALYPCRPGFRPGLWSAGPTARPGTGERPVGAPDHSQGRNPWAERAFYVLIGISVRLHLAFASGFLSVCEGKGLYVRRACQYVILRISSRPCTWPECSFYRRPIYCLSAPYASHGVPEIREP